MSLVLMSLLAGCNALRFTYGQAPALTYWRLDRYVDIAHEQAPQVRAAIDGWYRWHRARELPVYADMLARLRAHAVQPATAAQVCAWFDEGMARLDAALAQALPAAAALAPLMTLQQIAHLERRQRALNDDYADDYLQPSAQARRRAQVERVVERVEDFYGRLDASQRQRIAEGVARSPFDPERALAERRQQQQALVDTLRRVVAEQPPPEQVQAMLEALAAQWRRSPREDHARYQQRLREYNCGFVADIHNAATAAQREHAARKLQAYEADLRALAAGAFPG